jgi:hypothetical protein
MQMRAVKQPTLFEVAKRERRGTTSDAGAPVRGNSLGSSAATPVHGQQTEQALTPAARFHAVSPLSNLLHEVCAHCGKEIQLPGFVIPDFEDLGAFCNEACGDRQFRLFLEEGQE